jgi:putative chitinase
MDPTTLQNATGCTPATANLFAGPISSAFDEFSISSPVRQAAFLAQTAYESELFTALEENLNYSADELLRTWPSKFTPATAANYAEQPQKIASYVYANQNGNGDEASNDGWTYRGRGLIQLTFKDTYNACFEALCLTPQTNPDVLSTPNQAAASAGWFWYSRGLNALADKQLFQSITGRINPAMLGLDQRTALYQRALKALNQ